jgi:hypothetical protein
MTWTIQGKQTGTWTNKVRDQLLASFLLTEDGFRLLQQDSYKIVIDYGWDTMGRSEVDFSKVARTEG